MVRSVRHHAAPSLSCFDGKGMVAIAGEIALNRKGIVLRN